MARLSKYFTPVIQGTERDLVNEILNLGKLDLLLVETFEGKALIAQIWRDNLATTQNTFQDLTNKNKVGLAEPFFTVFVDHAKLINHETSEPLKCGLLGYLLPYPQRLLFQTDPLNFRSRFEPPEFSQKLNDVRRVANQLETKLSEFELSVLWIRRGDLNLPLLFHFVRKNLIRVGTLPSLDRLTEEFKRGSLSPQNLRQFFGTQAAFFDLNLEQFQDASCPLNQIKDAIIRCLTDLGSRVIGESISPSEYSPLPDLGL